MLPAENAGSARGREVYFESPEPFFPVSPPFPGSIHLSQGRKESPSRAFAPSHPGGEFPHIFSFRRRRCPGGKGGDGQGKLDDCHVEGDGEAGEKNSASRERGEGGFFEAPGHPCRGEKESSSLSSSRFPFRFPSYSRKISWRRRSSREVMPQVLRKAWIRWSRGSPGAPYSRNASRRR